MASSLAKRLQLKTGQSMLVLSAPDGYIASLEPLPEGVTVTTTPDSGTVDVVHLFAANRADLERNAAVAQGAFKPGGLFWVSYPKKSSGIDTDLTRDEGWSAIFAAGWQPVRQIAIDATWSALRFKPAEHSSEDAAVDAQYAGAKAHLRPIYEELMRVGQALGSDVTVTTRKSYVALVRGKQFANIVPSTNSRLDLVLKLPHVEATGRLSPSKNVGSGAMTHKVALTSVDEVDDEVAERMRQAYANG